MFIVIEGIDGTGKSTQVSLLGDWLGREKGGEVFLTAEPSHGVVGKLLREILGGERQVDASSLALLFTADRMQHLAREIEPSLSLGEIIVCERYYYSTIAYQAAQGLDWDWLVELNKFARKPDLAFLIDLEAEEGVNRTSTSEIFEEKEFLKKVRTNYLRFDDLVVVDGSKSIDEIQDLLRAEISTRLDS